MAVELDTDLKLRTKPQFAVSQDYHGWQATLGIKSKASERESVGHNHDLRHANGESRIDIRQEI